MTQSVSGFTKFTQNVATFIHNPGNFHQRTATQEFFIGLTVLVSTIIAVVTPIIGWATLYYTLKEYGSCVNAFKQKQTQQINTLKSYPEYITQLKDALQTANHLICNGNKRRLQAHGSVSKTDKAFRQTLRDYLNKNYMRPVPQEKWSLFKRKVEYREDIAAFKLDVREHLKDTQYHLTDSPDVHNIATIQRPQFKITQHPQKIISKQTHSSLVHKIASFLHNPANIRNRNAAQELLVCIATIVTAIALPIIGWALLYYTSKEYNRQVARMENKQLQLRADLDHSIHLAKSLKTALKKANDKIKQGNTDLIDTRVNIKRADRNFRAHILRILKAPDLNVSELKAEIKKVLDDENYRIATCPVMEPIIIV